MEYEYPGYMEFLMKGYFKWQGYFLIIYFFPLNGNSTRVSSCRAESILNTASVIFCPDDGFHGRASVLIQPGILQCVFRQVSFHLGKRQIFQIVSILRGGGGIVRATHDVNELYFYL